MKVLVLTDLHLTGTGALVGGRNSDGNLAWCLEHILEHHADAAAGVVMGDLSDNGSFASYDYLRESLKNLPFPVYLTLGNHDNRINYGRVFGLSEIVDGGYAQSSFKINDTWQGIVLDCNEKGFPGGCLDSDRLKWLDDELARSDRLNVIFLHHPPIAVGLPGFDAEPLAGAEKLGRIIDKHRDKVRQLVFGHCHLPICGNWRGVPIGSIRGTNHASWANFKDREFEIATGLPQAYGVMWLNGSDLALHMVEFGHEGKVAPSDEAIIA